jgi:hypothetical protein
MITVNGSPTRVNRTWLRQGGTRRELPSPVIFEQLSELKRQAGYANVMRPRWRPKSI